ncbi:MAG: fimbrillin family protein [Alistipes sp.]|nr:fimbrillin family protein [Alistipes sp.]
MTAKFIRTFIVLSSVVLNLSCEKQQEYNEQSTLKGLTIKATADASSRTTFDGESSKWSIDDKLNIYISGGGISAPQTKIFTITNAEQGIFTNDEVEITSDTEYKFHAIYPATNIDSETQSASVEIGAASQTQNDTAPAAHIAALDPLYGCATATPEAVSINMNHTAVALKLDLQNDTGNNITIKKLLVTAPTGVAIAGTHTVNTETGTITPSNENGATSRTIELTLNPAVTIANEGKHTVWIATAPFTIEQGGSLLFTAIDTSGNEYDVIRSFVNGHQFKSGSISSTTLNITEQATSKQNKDVTLNFITTGNFDNQATDMNNTVNKLIYQDGVYISFINTTKGCYTNNNGLALNSMKNGGEATITIPQLSGYKIRGVIFNNLKDNYVTKAELYNSNDKNNACQIQNKGNQGDFSPNLTGMQVRFDNIVGIQNDSQYFFKIYGGASGNYIICSIVITYQRIK